MSAAVGRLRQYINDDMFTIVAARAALPTPLAQWLGEPDTGTFYCGSGRI